MPPLFPNESAPPSQEQLEDGAWLLRGFATPDVPALITEIAYINEVSPFRQLVTPSGHTMSVAMTNCGRCGWVSDRSGYRYDPIDPDTGKPWPPFPALFLDLAARAAAAAGFPNYVPDACLINRYVPSAKLSLHQDKDENDPYAPIVSVSIGLPATFQWGGRKRGDPVRRMLLESGDIVVWGGPARFVYHGVSPLKPGEHPLTGPTRLNLTFRKVY